MSRETIEVGPRIGGETVRTGRTAKIVMPHDHGHLLGTWHKAGSAEVGQAIAAALKKKEH